jgi:hypothetical protein
MTMSCPSARSNADKPHQGEKERCALNLAKHGTALVQFRL